MGAAMWKQPCFQRCWHVAPIPCTCLQHHYSTSNPLMLIEIFINAYTWSQTTGQMNSSSVNVRKTDYSGRCLGIRKCASSREIDRNRLDQLHRGILPRTLSRYTLVRFSDSPYLDVRSCEKQCNTPGARHTCKLFPRPRSVNTGSGGISTQSIRNIGLSSSEAVVLDGSTARKW